MTRELNPGPLAHQSLLLPLGQQGSQYILGIIINLSSTRNPDFREVTLEKDGQEVLRFAIANGFRNIQNLVQKLKRGKSPYHYVEVMACPSGNNLLYYHFRF